MKALKTILLLAFVTITLTSCGSDDDSDSISGEGSFVYDGSTFSLSKGTIIDFGGDDYYGTDVYNFDIELTSDGLNADSNGEISGRGDVVYFELWTDQASGLKSGTYTYGSDVADFIFTAGDVGVNCQSNSGDGNCTFQSSATAGTVTINRSGNNYDMSFTLTLASGDVISGDYDGTLRSFTAR